MSNEREIVSRYKVDLCVHTGKIAHTTFFAATRHLKRLARSNGTDVGQYTCYECHHCKHWHVAHGKTPKPQPPKPPPKFVPKKCQYCTYKCESAYKRQRCPNCAGPLVVDI